VVVVDQEVDHRKGVHRRPKVVRQRPQNQVAQELDHRKGARRRHRVVRQQAQNQVAQVDPADQGSAVADSTSTICWSDYQRSLWRILKPAIRSWFPARKALTQVDSRLFH